ncbi:MAG TPA: gamma-glutamyltransferase [Nevskiaceae bacterium]|nr:gamma-glutamyltransferase [Nevskiaceae bacterium]
MSKPNSVNLSPAAWPRGEYERWMAAQNVDRTSAGEARGRNGAVTVAYNGLAARAGLEALKQGGTAVDAALTAALAQVALTAGAPISYFGIMSLVYFEAATGKVHTMNAEWNTVRGETEPLTIPGGFDFSSADALRGKGDPSGRTALVGGFMKGVGEAHRRFGRLPFASLFEPSIYICEHGMPVTALVAEQIAFRKNDLARRADTRSIFYKGDGGIYREGDLFRQPQAAQTLRTVAAQGADYFYTGAWAEKLVREVQAEGGRMTLDDLKDYQVLWSDAQVAELPGGYSLHMPPHPNAGTINLIEALNLAEAAKLADDGPWWKSGTSLRKAVEITSQMMAMFLPDAMLAQIYPGLDLSPQARVTPAHAQELWKRMQAGAKLARFAPAPPRHSDDVVAVDAAGNMAAITHSINTVFWGKTAIFIDGISISDAASFQQAQIAKVQPGERLPAPTETGVLFKDGKPHLAFASMGAGLHQRSFQGLFNVMRFGMSVPEAINAPDFYMPTTDPKTYTSTLAVPGGRFPKQVLDETGLAWREVPLAEARLGGEGKWVAISRDARTGQLEAASHNRNNSDACAY